MGQPIMDARMQEMSDLNTVSLDEDVPVGIALAVSPADAMLLTLTLSRASRGETDRDTRLRLDAMYQEVRRQARNGILGL